MNILTDEEVIELCCERLSWTDDELIRAVEAAVLKKLAEQIGIEPVGFMNTRYKTMYSAGDAEDGDAWMCAAFRSGELVPLYTETQLLSVQQKAAEACAKVASAIHQDAAEAIRNVEWMEYL